METATLEVGDLEQFHRASGNLQARRVAQIRPVSAGIVRSLEVEEGDVVGEGQLLARLDGREASLAAKRDSVSATNARHQLARLQGIASNDAIAREEIDKQQYELESAIAAAKLSKHQASLATITAPFAGTITARNVDEGNFASSADILFEIADLAELELELHLPEREAAKVRVDAVVDIELLDGSVFQGKVMRRAPVVDPVTGTVKFTVRSATFPAAAVPGAFVRARILLDSRTQVPTLAKSSVFRFEDAPQVYVLENGKAKRTPVELGLEGAERVEVLGGLAPDQVIVRDAAGISEGMAVKALGSDPAPDDVGEGEGRGRGKGGGGHGGGS